MGWITRGLCGPEGVEPHPADAVGSTGARDRNVALGFTLIGVLHAVAAAHAVVEVRLARLTDPDPPTLLAGLLADAVRCVASA
jgi:hypothetical protein